MIRLKELRRLKGINQDEVASAIGLSRAAYTNLENGKRETNFTTLVTLAGFFGVTVDYLLGRPSAPPVQREEVPPLLASLIASFKELNAEGQERLVEQADDMVQSGKYKKTASPKMGKAANE